MMFWSEAFDTASVVPVSADPRQHGYVARGRRSGADEWRLLQIDENRHVIDLDLQFVPMEVQYLHGKVDWLPITASLTALPKGCVRVGNDIVIRDQITRKLRGVPITEVSKVLRDGSLHVLYSTGEPIRPPKQSTNTTSSTDVAHTTNQIQDVFHLENPKTIFGGVWSGMKNVAIGLGGAAVAVLSGPVVGAKEDGLKGALVGTVQGVANGTVLAVCGCVTGTTQVIKGIRNTPEACAQMVRNTMVWDEEVGKWTTYDIPAELEKYANAPTEQEILQKARVNKIRKETQAPSDTSMYETLGVANTATASEIKTAYMKLALKHHPDRNQADPVAAKIEFQKINEAYHVLSDAVQRAQYDRGGLSALKDNDLASQSLTDIISTIIGAQHLKDLVGTTLLGLIFLDGGQMSDTDKKQLTGMRRAKLASRLTFFAANGIVIESIDRAMQSPLGPELVHLIGRCYLNEAERYLAKEHNDVFTSIRQDVVSTKEKWMSSAQAVQSTASGILDLTRRTRQGANPQDMNLEGVGGKFVDLMWYLIQQDITDLIESVVQMVLYDTSLDGPGRVARCEAIVEIGNQLLKLGRPFEWGVDRSDLMNKF
eukprot:PhF_6_TR26428/c2_g1_i1/m.38248